MRKHIVNFMAVVGFLLIVGLVGGWESRYTRTATISTAAAGHYEAEDSVGNIWAFDGGNYAVGQEIKMIMDNNHTIGIYDDTIIRVRAK